MDGERGDMPGKEELPILRRDAPVYCPLPRRHFLSFMPSFFPHPFTLLLLLFPLACRLPLALVFIPFVPARRPCLGFWRSCVSVCVKRLAGRGCSVCDAEALPAMS